MAASASAACFRIFLMPIDTTKTTMQVTGKFSSVVDKVKSKGPLTLYNGALAAASATFVGHYPWYALVIAVLFILETFTSHLLYHTQVLYLQLLVGKDSQAGYTTCRVGKESNFGFLLFCHQ